LPPNKEPGEIDETLVNADTPAADLTSTDASTTTEEAASPSSSERTEETAKAEEGPKSMAEAIAEAIKPDTDKDPDATPDPDTPAKEGETPAKTEADPATKPDATPDPATAETGDPAEPDDPTEDELKALPPRSAKRIRQLLSQRNAVRRELADVSVDAEHYRNIRGFMQEARLEDGEVAELFKVGRLLKGDDPAGYEEALDIVLPIAQSLLEMTGRALPKDLNAKVENGELTEDLAREQAKLRTRATTAERRATVVQTEVQTQQQTQQVTQLRHAIGTAVTQWEQQVRQSDPDFGLKADALRDAAFAIIAERGRPKTPQEAVEFAKAGYERVNKWFSAARPAPKASRPTPQGPGANRSGLSPEPKSLADAIGGAMRAGQAR